MSNIVQLVYGGEPFEEDIPEIRADIHSMLVENTCEVTFIKVDGTERVMTCTLRPDVLPPQTLTEDAAAKEPNPYTISVWDVNAAGWRSFRVANVRFVRVVG